MTETLTPLDSLFLHLESPRSPMHLGSVAVFEGGPLTFDDGSLRIDELRRHIGSRLMFVPKLRQRLSPSPLMLLSRQWEDYPSFDIAEHVRQAALPAPGTDAQLFELAAEILSWPLDRSRPLWEMWFVEGLGHGRVAIVQKLHHTLADGLAGVELASVLLDVRRHPPVSGGGAGKPWHAEPVPGVAEVAAHDAVALAGRIGQGVRRAAEAFAHPGRSVSEAAEVVAGLGTLLRRESLAPRYSINTPIGRRRTLEVVRQSMDNIKAVQRWAGVTVNDVLLTAVAGGTRALLERRGEEARALQVLVPVGFAHDDGHGLGNNVAAMLVRLPLDEPDPLLRLRKVAAATAAGKRHHQAQASAALLSMLGAGLQPGIGAVAGLVGHQPFVNMVVTNVPGPSFPLYALGGRMLDVVPFVPIAGNLSIGVAALSYHGRLAVGLLADRDNTRDLPVMAKAMARTFDALTQRARAAACETDVRPVQARAS